MNNLNGPIDINPNHRDMVFDILRKHIPANVKVWVFGSRADWTTKDSSDLDIALEGDSALEYDTIIALEMAFEESSLPYMVDVIDINQVGDNFKRIVESQRTPLGRLIERWPSCMLVECVDMIHDAIFPIEDDTPYIDLAHMAEGTHIRYDNASDTGGIKGCFQRGDILFGERHPDIYKIFKADFDGICSMDIRVLRPTAKADAGYLAYLMASKEFTDIITRCMRDTAVSQSDVDVILHYNILVPPLDDQRAIIHTINALDAKLVLNRRMSQTLEEMIQVLFTSWFVVFDPVRAKMDGQLRHISEDLSLFPDTLTDSKLGFVPEGWGVKQLGDVVKVVNGSTFDTTHKGVHCCVTPKDISGLVVVDTEQKITDADLLKKGCGILPSGTLLVSSEHLAISDVPMAIAQRLVAIPPDNNIPSLFLLLWCRIFHKDITTDDSISQGIDKSSLQNIPLIVPNRDILTKFKQITNIWYKRIVMNEYESRNMTAQRDALLSKMTSGVSYGG